MSFVIGGSSGHFETIRQSKQGRKGGILASSGNKNNVILISTKVHLKNNIVIIEVLYYRTNSLRNNPMQLSLL